MLQRPLEIERRLSKKDSNVFGNVMYLLMRRCNQPFSEIKKMPIPTVLKMLEGMEAENKAKEKAYKQARRKR